MSAAHISPDDSQDGVVLACRAYPLGNIEIEILGSPRGRLKIGR